MQSNSTSIPSISEGSLAIGTLSDSSKVTVCLGPIWTAIQSSQSLRRRGNAPPSSDQAAQQDKGPISIVAADGLMNSSQLQIMTPLLHFLQLVLCENHNTALQVRSDLAVSREKEVWKERGEGEGENRKRERERERVD